MLLPMPLEPPATATTDMVNVIEMEVMMRGGIAWYWNLSVQEVDVDVPCFCAPSLTLIYSIPCGEKRKVHPTLGSLSE